MTRSDEALTPEQALMAYTAGGAYAEREEARKGRIMQGMAADPAVLSLWDGLFAGRHTYGQSRLRR
jgi:predicted amidohydrolase YtcJ